MDETCLSDIEYCKSREYWYCVAKTLAEMEALEFIGSSTPGNNPVECIGTCFVDVRDTAEAMLLVYESPEIEGRYICSASEILMQELVNLLKEIYLEYDNRKSYEEVPNAVQG